MWDLAQPAEQPPVVMWADDPNFPRAVAPAEPNDEEFDDRFDILLMPENDFNDEL